MRDLLREGLAITLPISEWERASLSASVTNLNQIDLGRLSPDLVRELTNVLDRFRFDDSKTVLVLARTEIFTHAATHQWLSRQLGQIRNHICFTDGSCLKWLSFCSNSLFFYSPYKTESNRLLRRFMAFAPEAIGNYNFQINSALPSLKTQALDQLLVQYNLECGEEVAYFPFMFNTPDPDQALSFSHSQRRSHFTSSMHPNVILVDLTEAAVADADFLQYVGDFIFNTCFDSRTQLLLCASPHHFGNLPAPSRVEHVVRAVLAGVSDMPQLVFDNIAIVTGALANIHLASFAGSRLLILHDTCAFWRSDPAAYSAFDAVRVFVSMPHWQDAAVLDLFSTATDRPCQIVRADRDLTSARGRRIPIV